MVANRSRLLSLIVFVFAISSGVKPSESARVFAIINHCKETIWPAIFPNDVTFGNGGFTLKPGQSTVLTAPGNFSGRIWARTGCTFDSAGIGPCQTGACGTNLGCTGSGETPATLAEFTLASPNFYDVSLVDGFNVPMVVTPVNGQGNCTVSGCDYDLRKSCPSDLQRRADGKTVGCRSACDVFNTDEYCCRGAYGGPSVCLPTSYSKTFKSACPTAYSYAYDDPTSIFTCSDADYVIAFCSSRSKQVCSLRNNKLVCNTSKSSDAFRSLPWPLTVALFLSLIYVMNLSNML